MGVVGNVSLVYCLHEKEERTSRRGRRGESEEVNNWLGSRMEIKWQKQHRFKSESHSQLRRRDEKGS